jgi:signal transduction histidine kinase/CheY-like chemotaxis protein
MEWVLAVVAASLSCAAAALRLALKARAQNRRLLTLNRSLDQRIADHARRLRQALDAASGHALELAAANQAQSDFLAGMNHAVRTPLNAVIGFSDLLLRNTDHEPLTHRQMRAVQQVRAAGGQLLDLIDRVLDFAELDTGMTDLSLERLDPQILVRQAMDAVRAEAAAAGVTLAAAPTPLAGVAVMADAARLRQILHNLLTNAVRHNRSGGGVRVELRHASDADPARTLIVVHDTGPGIDPDQMQRLFQPFRRLSACGSDAGHVNGSPGVSIGVGLAVSRRLAEAMGGELGVVSTPGQGTSFTLSLPVSMTQAQFVAGHAEEKPPAIPPVDLASTTVLYIEDHPANIALMRQVMPALGPALHVAETGAEGLALARDLMPDLILLDLHLPDMDGFQVKAALAADPLTRGVPVVALTAGAGCADARRGRKAGFADWLTKPLDIVLLAATLQTVLATARRDSRRRAA